MIYVHMIKINANMQFVLCLGRFDVMGGWAWSWSIEFESRKSEFEL